MPEMKNLLKGNDLLERQLESYLQKQIAAGSLQEGDRLLSERAIGKIFNVSGVAIHNAMRPFIARGILEKIPRKGTFVKKQQSKVTATNRISVIFFHGGNASSLFMDPFYSALIGGIDLQVREVKREMVLIYMRPDTGSSAGGMLIDALQGSDGVIVIDPLPQLYKKMEPVLLEVKKPVVILNYEGTADAVDAVCIDSRKTARELTEFLIKQGHTRIACLYHYYDNQGFLHPNYENRILGYHDALRAHGIKEDASLLLNRENPFFDEMMALPNRPTAIFCAGDTLAVQVYRLAQEKGVRIPEDLAVVGHDNVSTCTTLTPPLTTMHIPLMELGVMAVKRLIDKQSEYAKGVETHYNIVLPGKLIERQSHGGFI